MLKQQILTLQIVYDSTIYKDPSKWFLEEIVSNVTENKNDFVIYLINYSKGEEIKPCDL